MINNLIEKINLKIARTVGYHQLDFSIWGNDVTDSLQCNYEFQHYVDTFMGLSNSITQPATIFLIVGPINLIQIRKIKTQYEKLSSTQKMIVHVKCSMHSSLLEKTICAVSDIEKYLPVDLAYLNYPIDLYDIIQEITKIKEAVHVK